MHVLVRQALGHSSEDGHNPPPDDNIPSLCTLILDTVAGLHKDMDSLVGDDDEEVGRVGVMMEAIDLQQVGVDTCGTALRLVLQILNFQRFK